MKVHNRGKKTTSTDITEELRETKCEELEERVAKVEDEHAYMI